MSQDVLLEVEDGIATITLNRPKSMNALDLRLAEALVDALVRVEQDPGAKVVVLRGNGGAFLAGGDVRKFHEARSEGTAAFVEKREAKFSGR